MMLLALVVASGNLLFASAAGPFSVKTATVNCSAFDSTDRNMVVWYPETGSHPLVSYAHGNSGGGSGTLASYNGVASEMASYGYFVVAPRSCNTGCRDNGQTLPFDPPGFGRFYHEQYKAIECARQYAAEGDSVFQTLNVNAGVGLSGHSMGGQATLFGSLKKDYDPAAYNVKAAVMHHAYTHSYPAPQIPYLGITGSSDFIALPSMTKNFHNAAANTGLAGRGYANKRGASHFLPNGSGADTRSMGRFTAAFFKLFVDNTTSDAGGDYEEMIYGRGSTSLCGGGYGTMSECDVGEDVPIPDQFSCSDCSTYGFGSDGCGCGHCGSFGACTFSCDPSSPYYSGRACLV